jgi:hypothetical protein
MAKGDGLSMAMQGWGGLVCGNILCVGRGTCLGLVGDFPWAYQGLVVGCNSTWEGGVQGSKSSLLDSRWLGCHQQQDGTLCLLMPRCDTWSDSRYVISV